MNAHVASLAANVRGLRESHGLSLSQLSERSGVAKATLFKVERGRTNPTLETLLSIAETFDVPVERLIAAPTPMNIEVVRAGQGQDISDDSSDGRIVRSQVVRAGTLEIHTQRFYAGRMEVSPSHGAGSREHVIVVDGRVQVGPPGHEEELRAGDYATYPASSTHVWRAVGGDAAVWIFHTFPRAAGPVDDV